jgi:hypothetical protein
VKYEDLMYRFGFLLALLLMLLAILIEAAYY